MSIYFPELSSQIKTRLRQQGVTLIELMISITLGLIVILAATSLVVSTKALFLTQTDNIDTQDTARFALDNISRSLRQAGFMNYDYNNSQQITPSTASADLGGMDANQVSSTTAEISAPLGSSVNFSDVLVVRFFGSGSTGNGDGTMSNCAGFSIPAPTSQITADHDRGWSIYYVANNANGEPELFCKYNNPVTGSWSAQAIVKGVESFQILYGLDTSSPTDGLANKFLTANDINTLDNALVLVGATQKEKDEDKNRKTFWKKILVVKIALLVSGKEYSRSDSTVSQHNLFGADYAAANGTSDRGTTIEEKDLPIETVGRIRKIFAATVQLRNNCMIDPDHGICLPPN